MSKAAPKKDQPESQDPTIQQTARVLPGYKMKKQLTFEILKLDKTPRPLTITTKIEVEKKQVQVKNNKMEPPHVCEVVDLTDGVVKKLIVNTVLLKVLEENYPNHSYVGKSFLIAKTSPEGERKYALYDVNEIEAE